MDKDFNIEFFIDNKKVETSVVHYITIDEDKIELRFSVGKTTKNNAKFIISRKEYIEKS